MEIPIHLLACARITWKKIEYALIYDARKEGLRGNGSGRNEDRVK
jgi:hypothetical protein